ncbi:conserved hypothetical protein [sediment metagenome]|uniref:Ribosomal RNA large subunit methyltransferase K/L-like methyltransferase domain-containing protein n=1 Tax=sediment metagenome TaxID=749907 RepID=D9PJ27_9ZZZZ
MCGKKDGFVREDDALQKFEIMLLIMEEQLFIMLNTSGDALHKRGYRIEAGEAPIKENLGSALVRLSRWRYEENLYDPFCGSGTLAIEAVLMAKNRAPGLERHFAFERRSVADRSFLEEEKEKARQQEYKGTYQIYASDKDPEMIAMAKRNATNA